VSNRISASFRDPSGFVFSQGNKIYRQVNLVYQEDYDLLMSTGLYDRMVKGNFLIPHQEVTQIPILPELAYKVIEPEMISFITYPYEWSFSQLKDAALMTLAIEKQALAFGMTLKDASAYNIQFRFGAPIFIDTLSFAKYSEGQPWVAYRQFCQHFLAPLALMSKINLQMGKLLINNIDGIPLELCSKLLPRSTRFNAGLLMHIHLHAQAQARANEIQSANQPEAKTVKPPRVSKYGLLGLLDSLESIITHLNCNINHKLWADYYANTNYSNTAFEEKKALVYKILAPLAPRSVFDLGANTGIFSLEAAKIPNCMVISSDIDPEAVELNYQQLKQNKTKNVLPLVIDLTNPSPAIGWDNSERTSYLSRGKTDVVMALALIHHLAIANNLPLAAIAATFAKMGSYLLLEFVPKEDSQVKRLLSSRDDIFPNYSLDGLKSEFSACYDLVKEYSISGSQRTLLLLKSKL
jgi:SAM-dependent methyltransferase